MKLKKALLIFICFIFPVSIFSGCDYIKSIFDESETSAVESSTESSTGDGITVEDKALWYNPDDDYSVVTMYLTVKEGNSGDGTNHTWQEVNSYSVFYYQDLGIERYAVEGILQVGDENGLVEGQFGYDAIAPNSIVNVRGNTTSTAAQKSYKIEIDNGKGMWREQRTIILNKHIYDTVRFRNKLSYDLMKNIPGMISARTQFVHLYVKDLTGSNTTNGEFIDYGLYTQVEQFNNRYLRNHGFDTGASLYKAEMFEFFRYEDKIKMADDPEYDLKGFEEVLEIKGNNDHTKLINILEDLNDYYVPIEETFPKYFDEENYFTWLAFQILTGNVDTTSRNYFLYSPLNSEKWYFISWDNDGAWNTRRINDTNSIEGYEIGISNYWGCILHQRVLKVESYRQKLDEKIKEVMTYLSRDKLSPLLQRYSEVVMPYLYSTPDIAYARQTQNEYYDILNELHNFVDINYQLYLNSLEKPMPFYLGTPIITDDNKLRFNWDVAFDLDNERITYKIQVSDSYLFDNIIYETDDALLPEIEYNMLPYGQYFYRVIATNESGYSQAAFDYYEDRNSIRHYGVISFFIDSEGIYLDS
ncbi:MAG: hypothetical protein A2Y17_03525 [Clostridiales bacterium GWF2_38_85]|nr:MAG: hypothetical protein A2Y17_03525 [Clostridiales bacterium GWF2_38_85]